MADRWWMQWIEDPSVVTSKPRFLSHGDDCTCDECKARQVREQTQWTCSACGRTWVYRIPNGECTCGAKTDIKLPEPESPLPPPGGYYTVDYSDKPSPWSSKPGTLPALNLERLKKLWQETSEMAQNTGTAVFTSAQVRNPEPPRMIRQPERKPLALVTDYSMDGETWFRSDFAPSNADYQFMRSVTALQATFSGTDIFRFELFGQNPSAGANGGAAWNVLLKDEIATPSGAMIAYPDWWVRPGALREMGIVAQPTKWKLNVDRSGAGEMIDRRAAEKLAEDATRFGLTYSVDSEYVERRSAPALDPDLSGKITIKKNKPKKPKHVAPEYKRRFSEEE